MQKNILRVAISLPHPRHHFYRHRRADILGYGQSPTAYWKSCSGIPTHELGCMRIWRNPLKALTEHAIIEYGDTHQGLKTSRRLDDPLLGHDDSTQKTLTEHLRELDQAEANGLITEEEFHTLRTKLLNSY